MIDFQRQRAKMLEEQLVARGVRDPLVLAAFARVPREAFVPPELITSAYQDSPLPIGDGQTISQPYVVALAVEALGLEGGERVLEVGTGSGYAAAVVAQLALRVFTIERIPHLAEAARLRLSRLGYANIRVHWGDGTLGWSDHAPYDAILVSAGAPSVPQPLLTQLRVGGRLVMPIGANEDTQRLVCVTRDGRTRYHEHVLGDVRFVPLVGVGNAPPAPLLPLN
jgi:protein-L-isoaspartate(D-aspartate) O-methyltransferase